MNFDTYTQKSLEAVRLAQSLAREQGHQQLEQVHMLLALLRQEGGLSAQLLKKMDVTVESLEAAAEERLRKIPSVRGAVEADRFYVAPDMADTFAAAELQAEAMHDSFVSQEHLLLGLAEKARGPVRELFDAYRIGTEGILKALQSIRGNRQVTTDSPEGTYEALEKYGTDLVRKARDQKMDPVIGRDEEIRNVIRILSRKTKNNPCLIGEPGVGKTAIAEGLAQRIDIQHDLAVRRLHQAGEAGAVVRQRRGQVVQIRRHGDLMLRPRLCSRQAQRHHDQHQPSLHPSRPPVVSLPSSYHLHEKK